MASDADGISHRVQKGEHLSAILVRYGRGDPEVVWEHDANAELRDLGRTPNLLLEGDRVFVPLTVVGRKEKTAGSRHRFVQKASPIKLRIDLGALEFESDRFRNAPCTLRLKTLDLELKTDPEGVLECRVPPDSTEASLEIAERVISLRIGGLDPVESASGQLQRLFNLGFIEGEFDEQDEEELASAMEAFQQAHDLKLDGSCGPITQQKMVEAHGT